MSIYTKDSQNIYFLNDKNIVSSKTDTVPLSNAVASYDLLSTFVDELSTQDKNLSDYIRDHVEVSCNDICVVLSNLIARDKEDVSYRGEVFLSTEYEDPEHEGHLTHDNTLYALLYTNRPDTSEKSRTLHKGFLFKASTDDVLSDFTVYDKSKTSSVMHNNDFIFVMNEVNALSDVALSDITVIRDYDLSVKNLQD